MIQEFSNFLTPEESSKVIELASPAFKEMTVLGKDAPKDYRIADGTWLFDTNKLVKEIKKRISDIIKLPIENMEDLHVVKYNVGGEYKTHHDFFHLNTDYIDECLKTGGQRVKTALIYLNDDFKGGETDFPKLGQKIKPEKGKLVVWRNLTEDGQLDYDSLHAGLPVIEGCKYIAVLWIREKSFK